MPSNFEDLMRDVFGDGKAPRRVSAANAERYLDQTRKTEDALDALQKAGEDTNERLQKQLDELKRMSDGLDFDAIDREVKRDFGITPAEARAAREQTQKDKPVAVSAEEQAAKAKACFAELETVLAQELVGQEAFLHSLLIAFKRPFIMDWDENGVRNGMLVWGKNTSGRHTAVRLTAEGMAKHGLLDSGAVRLVDLALYPTQAEEKLFLQDLYMALLKSGVVVFDHYERCHPAFLQQVAELFCTGKVQLSTRYVMQKGNLVDAGSALTPQAVSCIPAGGNYLVLISEKGPDALAGAFGAKLVNALGDVCRTGELTAEHKAEIGRRQYAALQEKAKAKLGYELETGDDMGAFLAAQYTPAEGVGAMLDFSDKAYKALSQYRLEHEEGGKVALSVRDGSLMADFGSGKTKLLSLLPGAYKGELEAVKREITQIVGLKEIKEYIYSLEDHYRVQQLRKQQGMKSDAVSMHMIFTGNPGTGKTTIARLVSKYLKAIGVLSGGQLVEVTRADLVGKYVGHTAPLTTQVIKSAIGGVLFIDEAYSLYRGKDDSFGLEAIDTLVKGMEDNREDLLVILAGYSREMEVFLTANSGLRSRFPNIIEFPDYTGEELASIAEILAKSKGYRIQDEAKAALLDYFNVIQAMGSRESGNGRLARNVVEKAILDQSKRILKEPGTPLDLLEKRDFDLFESCGGESDGAEV
ncbi:MAG: AAA family ATPase [Clostridiaceae bacterium]|nr:AAA family ATPase [Clostridiaceae bacterium]